jgi:hypothetical protein
VLATAAREDRILLTFDKDFGELAARSALPPGCGVVLFRLPPPRSKAAGQRLAARIVARADWSGLFFDQKDEIVYKRVAGSHVMG